MTQALQLLTLQRGCSCKIVAVLLYILLSAKTLTDGKINVFSSPSETAFVCCNHTFRLNVFKLLCADSHHTRESWRSFEQLGRASDVFKALYYGLWKWHSGDKKVRHNLKNMVFILFTWVFPEVALDITQSILGYFLVTHESDKYTKHAWHKSFEVGVHRLSNQIYTNVLLWKELLQHSSDLLFQV